MSAVDWDTTTKPYIFHKYFDFEPAPATTTIPKEVEDKIKAGDMFAAVAELENKELYTDIQIELTLEKDVLHLYISGADKNKDACLISAHEITFPLKRHKIDFPKSKFVL